MHYRKHTLYKTFKDISMPEEANTHRSGLYKQTEQFKKDHWYEIHSLLPLLSTPHEQIIHLKEKQSLQGSFTISIIITVNKSINST